MKTLFLINPISGPKQARQKMKAALPLLKKHGEVYFSKQAGDVTRHVKKHLSDFDLFVVAGGDGTVHEASQALISSHKTLGIIPCGSGNGFALSLGIQPSISEAVDISINGKVHAIDCLKVNNLYSTNISGIGFDANICHSFAKSKKRGLFSYSILAVKLFFGYRPVAYRLSINDKIFTQRAFIIDFANIPQYGNNVNISHQSKPDDGKFEVVILKPFSFLNIPIILWKLFRNKIHTSPYYQCFTCTEASVERVDGKDLSIHIDGEPHIIPQKLSVSILPKALKVKIKKEIREQ